MENVTLMEQSNIKLKNKDLNNPNFYQALSRLRAHSFRPKLAYTIGYLGDKIDRIMRDAMMGAQEVTKKYAVLDENGKIVPDVDTDGNPVGSSFKEKEGFSKEEFEKELEELFEIEHDLNKYQIDINFLEDYKLSATDISALKPLFSGLDDE